MRNYGRVSLSVMLLVGALVSCDAVKQSHSPTELVPEESEPIVYVEFTPDSSSMRSTTEIEVSSAFELDSFTFVFGLDQIMDCGQFIAEDTTDGFGRRLYVFNAKKKRIFKSQGSRDSPLYEPHFFKNQLIDKVFIICQLAFDYLSGGDVYLFENGTIKYIGNIDVEGPEMETSLIDILNIQETKDETIFSFKGDSVLLNPGGESERIVANKGLRYVYKNGRFELVK